MKFRIVKSRNELQLDEYKIQKYSWFNGWHNALSLEELWPSFFYGYSSEFKGWIFFRECDAKNVLKYMTANFEDEVVEEIEMKVR